MRHLKQTWQLTGTRTVFNRCIRSTPIRCARLAIVRPDIAAEWISEMNEDADIARIDSQVDIEAWWRCSVCGDTYKASVKDRTVSEIGCPQCNASSSVNVSATAPRQSLSILQSHPEAAKRWHPTLNGLLQPSEFPPTSNAVVWWQSATQHEKPFQREVYLFVKDSRSPAEQRADLAKYEAQVIQELSSAAKAPSAYVEPVPSTLWGKDESSFILQFLSSSRVMLPSPYHTTSGLIEKQTEILSNQPIRKTDSALREKALGYYIHQIVKGKGVVDVKSEPFKLYARVSDVQSDLGGTVPSSIFDTNGENKWKTFFSLSQEQAVQVWQRGALSGASRIVDESSTQPACEERPDVQKFFLQPEAAYPKPMRKPKVVEMEPIVQRTQTRKVSRQQSEPELTRDDDGGRRSFGRFDELADAREADALYNLSDPNDDDPSTVVKNLQYDRDKSINDTLRRSPRRPSRRPFSMELPDDSSTNNTSQSGAAIVPPKQAIPNAPRVVARPKLVASVD